MLDLIKEKFVAAVIAALVSAGVGGLIAWFTARKNQKKKEIEDLREQLVELRERDEIFKNSIRAMLRQDIINTHDKYMAKFLTGAVIASFIACLAFTVVVIVLTCAGYTIPDTLIQYFFMAFGIEFGAAAAIKISKHQIKKAEVKERISALKENNLEIDKTDFNNNSTSSGFDDYELYDDSIMG